MRFLLDTNILIPLEDSRLVLAPTLAGFIRLAREHGHNLIYHPASEQDIARDPNQARRQQTLARLSQYTRLDSPPAYPDNTAQTNENDAADNEILYALQRNAAHALVTEDRGIHVKARAWGLSDKVFYIQTANDWLTRLHSDRQPALPNIRVINLYEMVVTHSFFDSLRNGYRDFNGWFARKSGQGCKAWIYGNDNANPEAVCIFDIQTDELINEDGRTLSGRALKLCTFKVGETVRGRKIGELFLKMAFRFATENGIENIFITALPEEEDLVDLLKDYGFVESGVWRGDTVYVKSHPNASPQDSALSALEFNRRYFPHFRDSTEVRKFIIPIQPQFHDILFPDSPRAGQLPLMTNDVGNAIKLAYLSHAQTAQIRSGDIVMFYRSRDDRALTSLGVVDNFLTSNDAEQIAGLVRRRTVYNLRQIREMAGKNTRVITFRLVRHFPRPITHDWLLEHGVVSGNIQTIRQISEEGYRQISEDAE